MKYKMNHALHKKASQSLLYTNKMPFAFAANWASVVVSIAVRTEVWSAMLTVYTVESERRTSHYKQRAYLLETATPVVIKYKFI